MKLLLDTHALLWWLADDARLSKPARTAIAAPLCAKRNGLISQTDAARALRAPALLLQLRGLQRATAVASAPAQHMPGHPADGARVARCLREPGTPPATNRAALHGHRSPMRSYFAHTRSFLRREAAPGAAGCALIPVRTLGSAVANRRCALLKRQQRDTLRDASKGVAGGCVSSLADERNTLLVCVDQQRSHERRRRRQRRTHELGWQRRHEPSGRRHEPSGRRHEPSGRRHEPSRSSRDDSRLLRTRGWVLRHKAFVHHDDVRLVQRCLHPRRLRERGLAMSERLVSFESVSVLRCPDGVSPWKGRGRVHRRMGECQLQRRHLDVPGRHSEGGGVPLRAFRRRGNGGRGRRSRSGVPVANQCSRAMGARHRLSQLARSSERADRGTQIETAAWLDSAQDAPGSVGTATFTTADG